MKPGRLGRRAVGAAVTLVAALAAPPALAVETRARANITVNLTKTLLEPPVVGGEGALEAAGL
jgi:hypothetical protein